MFSQCFERLLMLGDKKVACHAVFKVLLGREKCAREKAPAKTNGMVKSINHHCLFVFLLSSFFTSLAGPPASHVASPIPPSSPPVKVGKRADHLSPCPCLFLPPPPPAFQPSLSPSLTYRDDDDGECQMLPGQACKKFMFCLSRQRTLNGRR